MKKKNLILTIDIGNSQIHIGLFKGKRLVGDWHLESNETWSVKKYLGQINRLSKEIKQADQCVIASVVPVLTKKFQKVAIELSSQLPLIVNAKNTGGLKLKVDHPKEVGADRIVNALAAYEFYGAPAMVIDFGTAITIDLVSAKKEYLGGLIAPGMNLVADALYRKAVLLPEIDLKKPKKVRGTNTITCMQSGIFYSVVGLAETTINRLKKELHWKNPKIILTGGQSNLLASSFHFPFTIDDQLTLKGLRLIATP